MTPTDLLALVREASSGDHIEYYRGFLGINQTRKKYFLSRAAYILYEEGLVLLTQKKLKVDLSIYYAIRTSNPFQVSKYAIDEIRKMTI